MVFPRQEVKVEGRWIVDEAVDLHCTPEQIWPWLAQMGSGRAGWYSYDWIDNLGKKSFTAIDPDLVHIQVGQKITLGTISEVQINQLLTYQFGASASMTYLIEPLESGVRLWGRMRVDRAGLLLRLFLGPGHLFMLRKQFKELRKRVEQAQRSKSS